mgnify:FL=1
MTLIQNIENKTFRKAIGIEFARLRRERNQEIEKVAAAVGAYPETVDRLELGYYTAYGLTARLLKYYNKDIKIELVDRD